MTAEVTQLALGVDTSQVKAGTADLDKLAAAGTRAESATDRLEAAMREAATATQAAAAAAAQSTQRVDALLTGMQSASQAASAALTRASGAQRGIAESTQRVAAAQREQEKAARLAAMQTQQLGFQLNDFFVQVASGGNPLTALIQQGSQLSGVYGGVGAAFRAVTGLFTAARVAAGGAAGAVAGLALAAYQGAEQSNALQRSLILTGNAAGLTEGAFNSLAASVADATKTTIGSSRDALQQLVSTGRFSGEALRQAATATQLLSKTTGQATEEIVKSFVSLTGGVGKGAQALNEQYNFLTAAQLRQIKSLEDQGQAQQAVALTLENLNGRLGEASRNVGTLESAWTAAKNAISGYVDAARGVGREDTIDDAIANVEKALNRLRGAQNNTGVANPREFLTSIFGKSFGEQAADLEQLLAKLRQTKEFADQTAKAQGESAQREQARIKIATELEGTYTRQAQLAKEVARINALADTAGASQVERAQLLAAAIERLEPGIAAGKLQAQVGQVQRDLTTLTTSYAAAESLLEANRSAGLVSETAYYDARRGLIQASTESQIKALQDENAALSRYQAERAGKLSQAEILQGQEKIAANTARITTLTAEAAAKTAVLTTQQTAGAVQLTRQYEELAVAQSLYLENLTRTQDRELAAAGTGVQARQQLAARQRIEDEFRNRREALAARKRTGAFDQRPGDYERELRVLDDTLGQALSSFDSYYARKLAGEQDASAGMREAVANYASEAQNVANTTASAFSQGFKSLEDSLVSFITTGKGGFRSLITTILAEALRLQAVRPLLSSAIQALSGAFGGGGIALGASDGAGGIFDGRAIGGPVSANSAYRINERGAPEVATFGGKSYLLTGNQSGNVTPVSAGSAGGVTNIIVQGDVSERNLRAIAQAQSMAEYRASRRNF